MNSILKWLLGSDIDELVGHDNWRLGFVAGFDNYVRLLLLVVVIAMVYMTVRSYRREGDASRKVKVSLAGIRIVVILLSVMLLFRPAIIVTLAKTIHSSLVFLVDDSMSMALRDNYAASDQRQAMEALVASGDISTPGPAADRKALALMSRRDIVVDALQRSGVSGALAKDHPLIFMRFSTSQPGREAYTVNLGTVNVTDETGDEPESPRGGGIAPDDLGAVLERLSASGHETSIRKALRDALGQIEGRRVAGIVVLSDGQVTAQPTSLSGVRAVAAKRGVRLYAVCVGDPTPTKDLAIVGLQAPKHVRRGARAEFSVTLAHRNLAAESVTVILQRKRREDKEWSNAVASETVTLKAGADASLGIKAKGVQSVTLHHEPAELGEYIYRASVEARPDERNIDDNHAEAVVTVTDEKINVLLVGGYASWEMQYVRDYLLRLPQEYRLSVWQQNSARDINQVSSPGMRIAKLPRSLDELIGSPGGKPHPGYDVVILYDPRPMEGGFDGKFVELLKIFVEEQGKGLCYIAGSRYTDSTIRGGGEYKPLADMLPVILAANTFNAVARIERRRPEPWRISLTPYGREHPLTRLGGSAEETVNVWSILPGVFWTHPIVKAKLTARVLAVNTNPLRRTARNAPEPVMVVSSYGKGRVTYIGMDATWRWRYVQEGFYHRRFWGNVVRHLATLGARRITINTGGDKFTSGEKITIEVEAYDRGYKAVTDETITLKMINTDSGKTRGIVLDVVSGRAGLFKGTIDAAESGPFEFRVDDAIVTDDDAAVKRITIVPPQAEAARSEADPAMMTTLVSRDENFLWVHEIDKLSKLIPPGKLKKEWRVPHELWDSRLSMLLIVLLLCIEWILRKKHNMA